MNEKSFLDKEMAGVLCEIPNPVMYCDPSGYGTTRKQREEKRDTNGNRMGDEHYNGWLPDNSWVLPQDQMGAHLYERKNVSTRNNMKIFDIKNTPTYYPYGGDDNAGQAHLRLYDVTRDAGIKVRGNPHMTDEVLIKKFFIAYSTPHLQNIKGYIGVGKSGIVIKSNVTPLEAFIELNEWGINNDPNFKNLINSLNIQTMLNEDPEIQTCRQNNSQLDEFIKKHSSTYESNKKQEMEQTKNNKCGGK